MRHAMLALFAASLCLPLRAAAAPDIVDLARARIVLGPKADRLEVLAARELQRYLGLIGAGRCQIAAAPTTKGVYVILGTAASSPEVAQALRGARLAGTLGDEGYLLRTTARTVVLAADAPRGVLWSVYGVLQRLGVGFYLGGDALAGAGPARLPVGLSVVEKPAFKVRGSLPWYNFLNSPTTWDRDDFRYFFDQMAKMRNNFVGFHSYDSEPFCAYEYGGKLVGGEPLVTAHNYGWGTVDGLATKDFGFGTGDFFNGLEFGSKPATAPGTREQKIRRQQALLAEGLNYARARGLKVCVGFEVSGDPTTTDSQDRLVARLTALLKAYPMLDYVWIWQSEGLGGGSDVAAAGSPMELSVSRHEDAFKYLQNPARIHEAVRVMLYARLAHGILKRLAPKVRMAVSGWGGDKWMRFSDFYIGLDKTLPKDVIFAALDNIDPSMAPTVAEAYGKLQPGRERWPIPWWESDGGYSRRDQWGPQCNAKPFLPLCQDSLKKGAQGMLAIHWRTRDVEEAAALQAQFAWDTKLTYEGFYDNFARACYGPASWEDMSAIHRELEALGPRYTGAYGQVECGGFEWFSDGRLPIAAHLEKLARLKKSIRERRLEIMEETHRLGLERIDWMLTTIDWLMRYDAAAMVLRPGGEVDTLLGQAEDARRSGDGANADGLATRAAVAFRGCGLAEAIRTYPWKMTTCGEWGSLATINVKAYAMYMRIAKRIREAGGDPGTDDRALPAPDAPRIVMRTPPSIVEPGKPVPVEAVVVGARGPVQARYRAPGAVWRAVGLKRSHRLTWSGVIPGPAVTAAGIEYAVEVLGSGGTPVVRTASALALPMAPRFTTPSPTKPGAVTGLAAAVLPDYEVRLTWQPSIPGTDCLVTREPGAAGLYPMRTRLGELCDVSVSAGTEYRYTVAEIGADGKPGTASAASASVRWLPPPAAPASLEARPGAGKVRLTWPAFQGRVRGYRVYRDGESITPDPVPATTYLDTRAGADAEHTYCVAVVDRGGQEGPRSPQVAARAMPRPTGPAFVAALTVGSSPAPSIQPPGVLTANGLETNRGGWATFPNQPDFRLEGEFAVSLRFRADSIQAIPVLASCGEFQKQGWFVQIMYGRIRFSLGGDNILDAGSIEAGKPYHVACTYDGAKMHVYVNGQEAGSRPTPVVDLKPWTGPLYVSQYHFLEPMYQFHGVLSDLRIYAFALTGEEIGEEWRR